ncbi:Hypothetical protein FKW44_007137 [Caligus rogercresseyi]|uniref:Uncharacterized protein n=1 Tax=Caligus rogercresseyi TaxID=217165 RepID=A0A7T8KE95_CALRO|nr:Hypothetical protein FKW44_007137 [Caligus rogercresseyi]
MVQWLWMKTHLPPPQQNVVEIMEEEGQRSTSKSLGVSLEAEGQTEKDLSPSSSRVPVFYLLVLSKKEGICPSLVRE